MPISVTIIEDNDEIREGLAFLINASEGFICQSRYSNAEQLLAQLNEPYPDVILMDINLPGISGIECIVRLKERNIKSQIMMLTVFEDYENIYRSLKAGATGYLVKKTAPAQLLEGIKDIYNGGSPMSSQIARKVVLTFQEQKASGIKENLSSRELEVLDYLAKGYRYKEIAGILFLSIETVRTHIRNIYEKLQVNSRTEALLKVYPK